MTTYRRTETTTRVIRYEFPAPVNAKALGLADRLIIDEFQRLNGRAPTYDNDYWAEPTDEGVAFAFKFESMTTRSDQ